MRSSGRMDAPDPMTSGPMATVTGLADFVGRGPGTDTERRAANWLAAEISSAGRQVEIETFWCRPNWALAHLWHVALAIAGSLLALASPTVGIVLLAIALASVIADALTGISPGRRLTPEHASQNVVITPDGGTEPHAASTRLLLTANYDAGHTGLAYRLRPATTRLRSAVRGFTPGWLGWLAPGIAWLLAVAVLRDTGHKSHVVGVIQFVPTVGLLLGFALLLELATGDFSPAAGDNASGVAAVLQLAGLLAETPPQHLAVEVALTGAGDGDQLGLRRYLKAHGRRRRARDTIVLGIAPCAAGAPRWWQSDGAFLPLRYGATLRRLAQQVAAEEPHLGVRPHQSRGNSVALPARAAGLPALTIGCLDEHGVVPRSHHRTDVAAAVDAQAVDRAVQFALLLIDRIDAAVASTEHRPTSTPA